MNGWIVLDGLRCWDVFVVAGADLAGRAGWSVSFACWYRSDDADAGAFLGKRIEACSLNRQARVEMLWDCWRGIWSWCLVSAHQLTGLYASRARNMTR